MGTARKGPMDEIYPDLLDSTPNRIWTTAKLMQMNLKDSDKYICGT